MDRLAIKLREFYLSDSWFDDNDPECCVEYSDKIMIDFMRIICEEVGCKDNSYGDCLFCERKYIPRPLVIMPETDKRLPYGGC